MTKVKEKTVSILVNNKPDVLARIAGVFSLRSFNIESISANITKDPRMTKIILTTRGNQVNLDKIEKQINNLVDIVQVNDLTKIPSVRREMLLIRLKVSKENQKRVSQTIEKLEGKVLSKEGGSWIVEITGDADDIVNIIDQFEKFGMDDFTRTGTIALEQIHP
ncbi:MAG: acetolactate synthase small subunit [Deltaproteobacteria bacterium]|nr:acetolactate synthase small subunit [Deltaproteobacteria bacterium]